MKTPTASAPYLSVDTYNEDNAELQFLLSKPACFIIIGKPGCGKTSIAKKLAEVWHCQHLHGADVVEQEIKGKTTIGASMLDMLMNGEALSTEFVVQLLKEKLASPEVTHYGYILDDLPALAEESLSVQEQLDIIKGAQLKPDFIINIKIPDIDLNTRKVGIRTDYETGNDFLKTVWDGSEVPKAKSMEDIDEQVEDAEEGEETSDQNIKPIPFDKQTKERLVHLPEHQPKPVEEALATYNEVALKLLENYMSDHNRQHVIELDGNCSLDEQFQQLMAKLDTYTLRRAVVPLQLKSIDDDDEIPEEQDADDTLRNLCSFRMPGPRYRWRRSKWGKWCPVALKKGNMLQGKGEYAMTFMDKLYLLSSSRALSEFKKNPRPFLLPPQPVIPCKLAVLGPPLSGKSSVCKVLSKRYKATVFNLKNMMTSKFGEEKERMIEKTRKETLEYAIGLVQARLEQEYLLQSATESVQLQREPQATISDVVSSTDYIQKRFTPAVGEENEEVSSMVAQAIAEAEKQEIKLPVQVYVEVLKDAINQMMEDRKVLNPDAPLNGGWILDGFPDNRDQWAGMVEAGIVPDDYIILTDRSQTMEVVRQRYFDFHKEEILKLYEERLIAEKEVLLKEVDAEIERITEARRYEEEINAAAGTGEAEEKKSDTQVEEPSAVSGEQVDLNELEARPESTAGVDQGKTSPDAGDRLFSLKYQEETEKREALLAEMKEIEETDYGIPPADAPEFYPFRDICRAHDKDFNTLLNDIVGAGGKIDYSEIQNIPAEKIGNEIADEIDGSFGFQATEYSGIDAEEEEEDENVEVGEEGEEEEDEATTRDKKRHFGYSHTFDPVALKESFALCPGNSDIAAKYREKIYYFFSTDNRDKFIDNPLDYLPTDKPLPGPPLRVLLLGPRGGGKSLQARRLAKRLGIFHFSFRERLQELILSKAKHKVGAEHEEAKLLRKELSVSVEEAVRRGVADPASDDTVNTDESVETNYDFNDEEDAIHSSLVEDDVIPTEILEKILSPLWKEEPFKSTGFILEGFPRAADECQFLTQNDYFPDVAISLQIDDTDAAKRLLPARMEMWKQRRDMRLLKRSKIKEKKKEIRLAKMAVRRAELLVEQEERRLEVAETGEEEDEEDIEEIIQAEFEDDEEEDDGDDEEEETEEDARERMRTDFIESYDLELSKLAIVQDGLEEGLIPFIEVPAKRKPSIVAYLIDKQLRKYIELRSNLFEKIYPVSDQIASKLLTSGYKHPSLFQKWDPVKVHEGDVVPPVQSAVKPTFPVVYQHYVYFLSSLESREKFRSNPVQYAYEQTLDKPVVPIQIAVVGPPKSGKTTLAERFARDYGAVRVSVGQSVRKILATQADTNLAQQIQAHLLKGEVVPDELAVEALATVLLDTACTTRGYVLDGFPCTSQQMLLMSKRGILPIKIIELQIEAREMLNRAEKKTASQYELPLHNSDNILAVRYSCYCEHTAPLHVYYKKEHDNWVVVDAKISQWKLWNTSRDVAMKSVMKVQGYLQHIKKNGAAPISGLCISPRDYEHHIGVYGHYCPVCLNVNGQLTDCSDKSYLQHAIEYRGKYYKICCKDHMDIFLNSPDIFVPPIAQKALPPLHLLPKQRSRAEVKSMFPMQVEFSGYCPVAYADGGCRFESLIEGNPDLVVEYKNVLFQFKDEKALEKFMQFPEIYCDIKLPKKLPPKKQPMNLTMLPMLGYLEQGAASSLIRAMTEAGCLKPKFPYMSVRRSALFFIAVHLKAFNPKYLSYTRKKYTEKLQDFKDICSLVPYLGDHMPRNYPFSASDEFNRKMLVFLGHENRRATRDWVK